MALKVFEGQRNTDFYIECGAPAALLIHGFPGTPAEMRPLASTLNAAGWTTRGLLLPGFGAQIDSVFQRHPQEWIEAAVMTLQTLKAAHQPVALIGYSLGAAISILTAIRIKPDRLILLAPFWQFGTRGQRWILRLASPLARHLKPLSRANFADPRLRRFLGEFLQDTDLDDPEVQQFLRQTTVPVDLFARIHALGQQAYTCAALIDRPTLILQGQHDPVVKPDFTRRLMKRIDEEMITYGEIDAQHHLIDPVLPDWPRLQQAILDFVR